MLRNIDNYSTRPKIIKFGKNEDKVFEGVDFLQN